MEIISKRADEFASCDIMININKMKYKYEINNTK